MRCGLSNRTSVVSSATAGIELIPGAKGFAVRSIEIYLAATTASIFGLGVAAAQGITPTTPVALQSEDNANGAVALTKTALAWGTGPTIPAAFFKRISFPATIGSFVRWLFENGLYVPSGSSLILWNLAANGVADINIDGDE